MDYDNQERLTMAQRSMIISCFVYVIATLIVGLIGFSSNNDFLFKLSIAMYVYVIVTALVTIVFIEYGEDTHMSILFISYVLTFPVTLLTFLILMPADICRRIYWKIKLDKGGDDYYDT